MIRATEAEKAMATFIDMITPSVISFSTPHQAFFYATHSGAELDLLVMRRGKRYGFEFKHGDSVQPGFKH